MIGLTKFVRFNCAKAYKYIAQQSQINALRGQMLFRSTNLGMRQLDLIVGSWAKLNLPKYNYQQLVKFDEQVMKHQTPDLLKKIMGQLKIEQQLQIVKQIRQFALDGSFSKISNT